MRYFNRRQSFVPQVDRLESRRLLAAVAKYIGVDGTDLVGPTAAVGPDGIKDIHIAISNIPIVMTPTQVQTTINSLTITGPSGFQWVYGNGGMSKGNNPKAGPNIEAIIRPILPNDTTETVDVFINRLSGNFFL